MHAGRLRDRVTIEQNTSSEDEYGQAVPSWATLGTYRVEIRPTFGAGEVTHQVSMRPEVELATNESVYRIVWGERVLDILRADDPTNRGMELRLSCREIVAAS